MLTQVVWDADMRTITHEEASTVRARLVFKAERCANCCVYMCVRVWMFLGMYAQWRLVFKAERCADCCVCVCVCVFAHVCTHTS
jgi:hypothetical protein